MNVLDQGQESLQNVQNIDLSKVRVKDLRRKAVSITFTEEQLSLRKVAQQFFENEVKPVGCTTIF
jgi:hypothetical protein